MFKNKIIAILIILLVVISYLYFEREDKIITKVETKYDTITKVIDNTKPQSIRKIYIKITDTIDKNDTITKIIYKKKEVKKYRYKDTLKNGIITSTILADNIYKRDVKLKTFNKTTIITKERFKSQLYFGGSVILNNDKSVLNTSINGYYTHKNKWLLGAGVGYSYKQPNVTLTFAIKF
jgi:hypothetical protein